MKFSYDQCRDIVLGELQQSLGGIDGGQAEALCAELTRARKVFVVGVGRVLLSLQCFVKRLNHLGIPAFYVGEINEPAITKDDLLIVGSGSGESAFPVAIAQIARRKAEGVHIVHIGSNVESTVSSLADLCVRIPCRTKLYKDDEIDSQQPMSSLFEQSLLLFADVVCMMLVRDRDIDIKSLWEFHANLE